METYIDGMSEKTLAKPSTVQGQSLSTQLIIKSFWKSFGIDVHILISVSEIKSITKTGL